MDDDSKTDVPPASVRWSAWLGIRRGNGVSGCECLAADSLHLAGFRRSLEVNCDVAQAAAALVGARQMEVLVRLCLEHL